jgi:hypothetical protein
VGVSDSSGTVFVGQSFRDVLRLQQARQFHIVKAEQIEVVVSLMKDCQFHAKEFFVPSCVQRKLVVSDDKCAPLRFRQMGQHDYRYFVHPQFVRRKQSGVSCDHTIVLVNQYRVRPAELLHGRCNLIDLRVAVSPGISGIRLQPFDGLALNLDVNVRCGCSLQAPIIRAIKKLVKYSN